MIARVWLHLEMQGVSNKWVINRRRKHRHKSRRSKSRCHIGEVWAVVGVVVGEEEEGLLTRIGKIIEVTEEWELVGVGMDKAEEDNRVVEGAGEVIWVKG